MRSDIMHRLRQANPVAAPDSSYDEPQLRSRIDAITGAPASPDSVDAATVGWADRRSPGVSRGWLVPAGAAASVALLVGAGLTIAHERSDAHAGSAGAVTCRIAANVPVGWSAAARTVITDRVAAVGGRAGSFHLGGESITFTAHGIDPRTAATACAPTTAAIRPLVAGPVRADATGAHSATPLAGLGFGLPRDAGQLAGLSPSQRVRLATAMARYDCSPARAAEPASAALACGPSASRPVVYLLGPALVTSNGIGSATAQAPDPSIGQRQWSIRVSFEPAAQAVVADYTQRHHATRTVPVTTCSAQPASCANFLAAVIDNRVQSTSEIVAAVSGTMEVTGGFDRSSATLLADDLTAASIGLTATTP